MIENDISLSTLVISGVIAFVGWAVKAGLSASFKLLIEYIKKLLQQIGDNTLKVEVLDSKMGELANAVAMFPKMQTDLNAYFKMLKTIEDRFNVHIDTKH